MNERAIFDAALEIQDPGQRREFLRKACGDSSELRARIEALLAAHDGVGSFLDVPAIEQVQPGTSSPIDRTTDFSPQTRGEEDGDDDDIRRIVLSFLEPSQKPGSIGTLGHYEILKVLGQGGFGVVLKAFDEKLHRHVAIKMMNPRLAATSPPRKRFLREARAAAAIRHENIVQVHSVEEQPLPYLVMEYISGDTLQQKLDAKGPLSTAEVLHLGRQIAAGLAAAHASGLIHRDIKPGNILIEEGAEQKVKITDFGMARAADDASMTRSGVVSGTPMYMAPEQAQGQTLDHRADLFSLGSVLYQMACGRPPFRAATAIAVLRRVVEDMPRPLREILPEIPDWLVAIVDKLHCKNPDERFQSAKEVADLIARCQAELQLRGNVESLADILPKIRQPSLVAKELAEHVRLKTEEKPTPALKRQPSTRRSHPWATALAAMVLLFVGLSLTEATGVTNFRGTVIRLFSPDGTLVVEVDDPNVSVSIDGEEMVITGAGAKEIRLKPGQYKVLASKDGKEVHQELVTVTKNGRQVVRVSREVVPVAVNGDSPKTEGRLPPRYKNSLGMEFALVPKGKAWLGGGGGRPGDRLVEFKEDFYLGIYEVSQEEWEQVTSKNPSGFWNVEGVDAEDLKRFPVENVSWNDAQQFIKLLNEMSKESEWIYRLPTAAESEYACRGGPINRVDSTFDFYFDKPALKLLPAHANYDAAGIKRTSKVGSYAPNHLGLYDMHGNVWELCNDVLEGQGVVTQLMRGGCWAQDSIFCRASYNYGTGAGSKNNTMGLRVARVRVDPDRRAAEWVLANGGKVQIAPGGDVVSLDKLPTHKFSLGLISFGGLKFKDEKELECLANLAQLEQVFLGQAPITGLGLGYIATCPEIVVLALDSTVVRDGDLGVLKKLKKLQNLTLHNTRTTDAAIEHILECTRLTQLDLSLTGITDEGLKKLEVRKGLQSVHVDRTKVSAEGVKKFAAALPGCKIRWDGGTIEPTVVADPDRRLMRHESIDTTLRYYVGQNAESTADTVWEAASRSNVYCNTRPEAAKIGDLESPESLTRQQT